MGLLMFCTFGQGVMTVAILANEYTRKNILLVLWTLGFLAFDLYQVSKVFGG